MRNLIPVIVTCMLLLLVGIGETATLIVWTGNQNQQNTCGVLAYEVKPTIIANKLLFGQTLSSSSVQYHYSQKNGVCYANITFTSVSSGSSGYADVQSSLFDITNSKELAYLSLRSTGIGSLPETRYCFDYTNTGSSNCTSSEYDSLMTETMSTW